MKRIIQIIMFTALMLCSVTAFAEAPDLVFEKTDGQYIYCNNHEFIRRSELADTSNPQPKFIMSNEDLTADKYSMFVSHVNHTELRDKNNNMIDGGFDIEVDVLFSAKEDTVVEFNAAGFEVPKNGQYWYKGASYTYEDAWGCMNCWATYLQMPIRQIDSGIIYEPAEFEPVTITIKKGEKFWLSQILPNYSVVPLWRPMNLMSDFEIKSGVCDVNVAAFKATGTLGDRHNFIESAAFGDFDLDHQYKGIADSMNEVNAYLNYEITNDTWSGSSLPVTLYNQHVPEGKEVTQWYTHLNSRNDPWSGNISVESDMLEFKYYDPSKLRYYGENVPEDEKEDVWYFDTHHRDTAGYIPAYGGEAGDYIPNRELTPDDGTDYTCNLGNYGVKLNYNVTVTNSGDLTRYFSYKLATSSNNVVYVHDENGNLINGYALCKGKEESRVADYMTSISLPAHKTTSFTVTVILTTNYSGGMQNEFIINDMPTPALVYENSRQEIAKSDNFTGREYYKWENGKLYISSNDINDTNYRDVHWSDDERYALSGNYNEYRLYRTNGGFAMKAAVYDGIPYYSVQEYYKTMYFFDKDMYLTNSYTFDTYPKAYSNANGVHYVYAGAPMYSADGGRKWKYASDNVMPCWNYSKFSAKALNGGIYLSEDGIDFDPVQYQSFNGDYIDSVGDYYYYANGNHLYYSENGVYWSNYLCSERIKRLDYSAGDIIINGSIKLSPVDTSGTIIKADGQYLGFDKKPYILNDYTYAPLRFMCNALGADVDWDHCVITITKGDTVITLTENDTTAYVNGVAEEIAAPPVNDSGTAMLPVRFAAEKLGYTVDFDDGVVTIN